MLTTDLAAGGNRCVSILPYAGGRRRFGGRIDLCRFSRHWGTPGTVPGLLPPLISGLDMLDREAFQIGSAQTPLRS